MTRRRTELARRQSADREARRIAKAQMLKSEDTPSDVTHRRVEKLMRFVEKLGADELCMMLEQLAPRVLIAIEKSDGSCETRAMSERDGVVLRMNGGMLQISVAHQK